MSGYEEDESRPAKDFSEIILEIPSSRECRFSDHYSLPEQESSGNTMHVQRKYRLLRQSQGCADI